MIALSVNDRTQTAAQILLEGARETLGSETLQFILKDAEGRSGFTGSEATIFQEAGALLHILEGMYGIQGGRGLAQRIGRAAFQYGLKVLGDRAGLREISFRLQPGPRRIQSGLVRMAAVVAEQAGDVIAVTDEGSYWQWRSQQCPLCSSHQAADPCCYLTVGLIEEFMTWAGGGRFYRVVETACRAAGSPACVYQIDKQPLD